MFHMCQVDFASQEGAWAFGRCFQGALGPQLLPHFPLGSQIFQKVDVSGSLITVWLLLYMKIQYLWQLYSNQ